MPRIANGVLREVLGHDPEHAGPKWELDAGVAVGLNCQAGAGGTRLELVDDLLEHGERGRPAERHDLMAALELGQEQDLVDQRGRVLDFLAGLVDELADVGARKVCAVEEDEDAGERRAQLVRDGRP